MSRYYYDNSNPLASIPPATLNLLIINIIMFVATRLNENFMIGTFAMFFPTSPFFRIWQPITYMFMHGGFAHIFFNMWALWMFGAALERAIGTKKFLILYFVAGLGAEHPQSPHVKEYVSEASVHEHVCDWLPDPEEIMRILKVLGISSDKRVSWQD